MEKLQTLRDQLKNLIDEIFSDLARSRFTGVILDSEFVRKATIAIFEGTSLLGATDDQLRLYHAEIDKLKTDMNQGNIIDRSAILKKMDECYLRNFHQELQIPDLLDRFGGSHREFQL